MWLKRKAPASDEVPQLRDEYQRLLQETLPDMRPLRELTQPRAVAEVTVLAHERALRSGAVAARRPVPRPTGETAPKSSRTPACA